MLNSASPMTDYVDKALFLYSPEAEQTIEKIQANTLGCQISALAVEKFYLDPASCLDGYKHVVISAELAIIKEVLKLSSQHHFSVGIVPLENNKKMAVALDLPKKLDAAIELALQADPPAIDLVTCNGHILLFKAVIGWIPVLDASREMSKWQILFQTLKRFGRLRLRSFKVITAQEKKLSTVASGCMLVQRHAGDYASKLIESDSSVCDGTIGLIICSPFSIIEYCRFLIHLMTRPQRKRRLPSAVGYIKSASLTIETKEPMEVLIDGEQITTTPLKCETQPAATHVNLGPAVSANQAGVSKETFKIDNLPDEKEALKSAEKGIPFFSYASEERFKELFLQLNDDAKIDSRYIVMILLSTLLATIGLYLDSAAVIIGAMILAPLMTPLVACSMALLRGHNEMLKYSLEKIAIGIVLSLLAASLFTRAFPREVVTGEMLARLNPTLLDLGVAIISGIAAAYSKSHKEIAQSLAGVAIAVALVPPLAVTGIGLGRGDPAFFLQAFLLFSTNLVGIILAATFTFRVLGYSPAVKGRRGISIIVLLMVLITAPLYISYQQIIQNLIFEQHIETDRFLINDKYIIIQDAKTIIRGDQVFLTVKILAREPLDRKSLAALKNKLQSQFNRQLIIKVEIAYNL